MDILLKLTVLRKEKKIKQGEMANYLGITQVTLCRYEKGTQDMPLFMAEKYAEIVGCKLELFIT